MSWLPWLIIAVVIVLPVALRFAEGDNPGNSVEHTQQDEKPPDSSEDDALIAA